MANSIGSGALILTTSAAAFSAGLASARSQMAGFASQANSTMAGGFSRMGGAIKLAFGAAIAGLGIHAITSTMEAIDAAGKAAKRLGTSTAVFQGLTHAANLSGVSVEQLETGLGIFRRQVDGPLDEALLGVAKRLENIHDPGDRARVLVENFGRSGLQLAGMFEGGEQGLRDMIAEAERLGLTVSDEVAAKMEQANDAITRVKGAFTGAWQQTVVALAPVIEMIANGLTKSLEYLAPAVSFIGSYFSETFAIWGDILGIAWDAIKEVGLAIWNLIEPIFGFSNATVTGGDIAFNVFKYTAMGVSYLWDTLKLGAGAIAVVVGLIVEGFGQVIRAVSFALDQLKRLPASLRPDWLNNSIDAVDRFQEGVRQTGRDIRGWGTDAISGFGNSATAVGNWFDRRRAERQAAQQDQPGRPGAANLNARHNDKPIELKGANKDSADAVKLITAAQRTGVEQKMLDQARRNGQLQLEANRLLQGVVDGVRDWAGAFGVI